MRGTFVKGYKVVGLVLWIDENTFASSLVEKVFKKENLHLYTLSTAEDFTYLATDLKPVVIVMDIKTGLNHLERLKNQYEHSEILRSIPFIWIGDEDDQLAFVKNVVGKIQRPFDPFAIPQALKKILNFN